MKACASSFDWREKKQLKAVLFFKNYSLFSAAAHKKQQIPHSQQEIASSAREECYACVPGCCREWGLLVLYPALLETEEWRWQCKWKYWICWERRRIPGDNFFTAGLSHNGFSSGKKKFEEWLGLLPFMCNWKVLLNYMIWNLVLPHSVKLWALLSLPFVCRFTKMIRNHSLC